MNHHEAPSGPHVNLVLPAPAQALWGRVHEVLRGGFRDAPDRPGIVLTGGTLLAARLKHRSSQDIDIKLPQFRDLRDLAAGTPAGDALDDALARRGGSRAQTTERQLIYQFDDGILDLSAGPLWPSPSPTISWIEGQQTWVATNAQILSGKLIGRALSAPTRDLFDIAVASHLDVEAATAAINTLNEPDLVDALDTWDAMAEQHQAGGQHLVTNVPDALIPIQQDPAPNAIEAAKELAYRSITFRYNAKGCTVLGRRFTATKPLTEPLTSPSALLNACMHLGIYASRATIINDNHNALERLDEALCGKFEGYIEVKRVRLDGDPDRSREHAAANNLATTLADRMATGPGEPHIAIHADRFEIEWLPQTGKREILAQVTDAGALVNLLSRAGIEDPRKRPQRLLEMSREQERARAFQRTLT